MIPKVLYAAVSVILFLMGTSYVRPTEARCFGKLGTSGNLGDTVKFTICMKKGGSSVYKFMKVKVNGRERKIPRETWQDNWYWDWISDNRVEAQIKLRLRSSEIFDSDIKLAFHRRDETWRKFKVWITKQDQATSETTPLSTSIITAAPTTHLGRVDNCVEDLVGVGDVGNKVALTICLPSDFSLGGNMKYKTPNERIGYLGEGETSNGYTWKSEMTRSNIKISVVFLISSEEDFGTKQVAFDDDMKVFKTFRLEIQKRGAADENSKGGGSYAPAIIACILALVILIIIAIVGYKCYNKRNRGDASDNKESSTAV